MPETTLPDLVADLVATRHAGGYRFKIPERVLYQFAEHCDREGYPDGSITKEAVEGFLYGPHLRASTVRRNELALRQLVEHAQGVGWHAYVPAATTRVRVRHQPPYVLTDDEVARLFAAIDAQAMSAYSNKALVDPVLFRVLYGAGLRVSEALNPTLSDVDTAAGTLRIPRLEKRCGPEDPDHRPARRDPAGLHHGRPSGPRARRPRLLQPGPGQADQPVNRLLAVPRLPGRRRHRPLRRRSAPALAAPRLRRDQSETLG